jgi:hypothetical protein
MMMLFAYDGLIAIRKRITVRSPSFKEGAGHIINLDNVGKLAYGFRLAVSNDQSAIYVERVGRGTIQTIFDMCSIQ